MINPFFVLLFVYAALALAAHIYYRLYAGGHFASPEGRRLAQVISESSLADWHVEQYIAACPALGITVSHGSTGMGTRLWFGTKEYSYGNGYGTPDTPPYIDGGSSGRLIYRAFQHIRIAAIEDSRSKFYKEPPMNGGKAVIKP